MGVGEEGRTGVNIGFALVQEAVGNWGSLFLGTSRRVCRTNSELIHLRDKEVAVFMTQLPSVIS